MTVSTTSPTTFTIQKIVRLAYRRALLISDYQQPTTEQYSHAGDLLETISLHSQTRGLLARDVGFAEITLGANTYIYSMAGNVLDVVSTAMFIPSGVTDPANGELNVTPANRQEWQQLSAKAAQGVPTIYYTDRTADVLQVRIWPVPTSTEAGGRIRFQAHKFRSTMLDNTKTPDFEQYWTRWLIAQLATDLAIDNAAPMERIQMLQGIAQAAFQDCLSYSAERPPPMMILSHNSGWN